MSKMCNRECIAIINHNNPFNENKVNIYSNERAVYQHIKTNLEENRKIVISCALKVKVKMLEVMLANYGFVNKNFLICTGETYKHIKVEEQTNILNGVSSISYVRTIVKQWNKKTNHELVEIFEKYIIENNIDVLMYSSTISCGVSFNSEYFYTIYQFCADFLTSNHQRQMLMRVRHTQDKSFHIVFNKFSAKYKLQNDIQYVIKNVNTLVDNFNKKYTSNRQNLLVVNSEDKDYVEYRCNNLIKNFNMELNPIIEYLSILQHDKFKHINMIYEDIPTDLTILNPNDNSVLEAYETVQLEKYKEWLKIPYINLNEFVELFYKRIGKEKPVLNN